MSVSDPFPQSPFSSHLTNRILQALDEIPFASAATTSGDSYLVWTKVAHVVLFPLVSSFVCTTIPAPNAYANMKSNLECVHKLCSLIIQRTEQMAEALHLDIPALDSHGSAPTEPTSPALPPSTTPPKPAQAAQPVVPAPDPLPRPRPRCKGKQTHISQPAMPTQLTVPVVTKPVRLVVRFGGNPPATLRGLPTSDLFRLALVGIKGPQTLGVHWNRSNNLIISYPSGTPCRAVLAARPPLRTALGVPETTVMTIDTPWTKLMVSSVPVRPSPGAPVYSEADIINSFLLNPAVKNLTITRQPRWIRNPSNISGTHSSFAFSFEDPDHTFSRSLLKSSLFMFGSPVTVKKWKLPPPVAP
ncbi:hypothetical protein BDV93DRAFT_558604 [Ceratobasidium sp. AG-I]|nr:hypothetical protein BDV93DRAFT_558604 [Ceratobasidium sp. AG-I]